MLAKEDTLSELFDDLDSDKDEKVSADQVKSFLEDIGQEVKMAEIVDEMKKIGIDEKCQIDRDGFVEMMFPKFHMQWTTSKILPQQNIGKFPWGIESCFSWSGWD